MTKKSEEYIALAEECERRAASVKSPVYRDQFLELARQWRQLAARTFDQRRTKGGD